MNPALTSSPHHRQSLRWGRHWWVLGIGTVLGLVLGNQLNRVRPPEYRSDTSVLVLPVLPAQDFGAAGGRTSAELNLETEAELVKSVRVANTVREELGTTMTPQALLSRLDVVVTENSQVLKISYLTTSPEPARAAAQAFAEAYLALRTEEAEAELERTADVLQAQLDDLEEQLREASDRAAALAEGTPERSFAEAQRGILVSQINEVNSRLIPLNATAVNAGEVIMNATLASDAAGFPLLSRSVGLVAGLLLAVGAIALLSRRDQPILSAADVERATELPLLATVRVPAHRAADAPDDPETFDRLRNAVLGHDPILPVLQVAGPGRNGASSVVALGLARAVARARDAVVLIVATPVSTLAPPSGPDANAGLAELLRGDATVDDVLGNRPLEGWQVIGPGRASGELNALLQSPRLPRLLSELRERSVAAVLETSAIPASATAQITASVVGAVVVVAERRATTSSQLAETERLARHMAALTAGVVFAHPARRVGRVAAIIARVSGSAARRGRRRRLVVRGRFREAEPMLAGPVASDLIGEATVDRSPHGAPDRDAGTPAADDSRANSRPAPVNQGDAVEVAP
ncbi:MAG: hypothetical protein ACRD29_21270 [Acidimicrobiales bacterium]